MSWRRLEGLKAMRDAHLTAERQPISDSPRQRYARVGANVGGVAARMAAAALSSA